MKTKIVIVLLFFSSPTIFSQTIITQDSEKVYYDFELDYLPCIKHFNNLVQAPTSIENAIDFALKGIIIEDYNIMPISGILMSTTGIFPVELLDKKWLLIHINLQGEISNVEFWNGTKKVPNLSLVLKTMFQQNKILPGIIHGEPVNSQLYYLIN